MKKNYMFLAVILVITFLTMLPMFLDSYKSSHETKFHISNIDNLTVQIKRNPFHPSKVVGYIGNDFGYATDIFYPPLGHFITSYLNCIINNSVISIKIVHFLGLLLSGISMFYLSKTLYKDNYIGLLSSVIYMLFPYHLSNIYVRDALGEELIFIFLPLIFLGLYHLFNGNKKLFYLFFIVGYVGGILSYYILMIYLTFFILIFMLFKYKTSKTYLKEFIIATLFILLITSPFIVGILEHKMLGNYNLFKEGVMIQGTWGNALNLFKFIIPGFNWGTGEVRFYIDFIVLILLYNSLKHYKEFDSNYKFLLIFLIVSFILSSQFFPWDLLPIPFRIIQFPWRFLTFISLIISLLAPFCFIKIKDKSIISFVIILFLFLLSQPNLKQASNEVINPNNIEPFYGMGWQKEYLPVNAVNNIEYFEKRNNQIKSDKRVEILNNDLPYLEFKVFEDTKVELPRIYYLGYNMVDENNKEIKIYENENGFIEANVKKGKYKLDFNGTKLDNASRYLSIISILIFGLFVWRKK